MSLLIANAPVSYGVFGTITVEESTTPSALLTTMAQAGYTGSELGPPGFFGNVDETVAAFHSSGLAPVGTYVPLHTQDTDRELARDLSRMRQSFDELEALGSTGLVILADEGSNDLLAHPRHSPEHGLDDEGWQRLVSVVESARAEAEARGLATSFHPHISTYVETPSEIERLLESTNIGLTFDIGHIVLAGGDALELFAAWRERINHVHLKDVRLEVFEQAVRSGRADFDHWWAQLCQPVGTGDLNLVEFLNAAVRSDYRGWYVVEHDRAPLQAGDFPDVVAAQAENFSWLHTHLTLAEALREHPLPPHPAP